MSPSLKALVDRPFTDLRRTVSDQYKFFFTLNQRECNFAFKRQPCVGNSRKKLGCMVLLWSCPPFSSTARVLRCAALRIPRRWLLLLLLPTSTVHLPKHRHLAHLCKTKLRREPRVDVRCDKGLHHPWLEPKVVVPLSGELLLLLLRLVELLLLLRILL